MPGITIASGRKMLTNPKRKRGRPALPPRVGAQNTAKIIIPWIVMIIVFAAPRAAFACAACTGRSDDAVAEGLNVAVLTLLLVLLAVYGALFSSLVYFIHRAAKHPLTLPDMQKGAV